MPKARSMAARCLSPRSIRSAGARRLLVDSSDAGQVMKLVNFYPNMQGGRMRLEVDLDGTGPAEKTGTLWVDDFKVLGDPIVSEVVSSADQGRPAIDGRRHVTREVFEFDKMRAPFSVGYGQFVLEESYLEGTASRRQSARQGRFQDEARQPRRHLHSAAGSERRVRRYSGARADHLRDRKAKAFSASRLRCKARRPTRK